MASAFGVVRTSVSLLLWLFIFKVNADDPLVSIATTSPPVNKLEGKIIQLKNKDVQLTCIVENKPVGHEVQWAFRSSAPGSSLNQVSSATRSYDAFKWSIDNPFPTAWRLRIQNVQVSDEGSYFCKVQVTSKNYVEDSRQLWVVQAPEISDLDTSNDMVKNADDKARLECSATGRPEPLIIWTRMAGELLPNGGTEYIGRFLPIDRMMSTHAGIYKCNAKNYAGDDFRKFRIVVNFKPEVTSLASVVYQKVGYVKQLVCDIKAYPQPSSSQISWMVNKRVLKPNGRITIRNIPGASNSITSIVNFNGVQPEDYGEYRCTAINDRGDGYTIIELKESYQPTEDRSNMIVLGASSIAANIVITIIIFMCGLLLQRFQLP